MESLFFNITDTCYKITHLFTTDTSYLKRVDISNGIFFLESTFVKRSHTLPIFAIDAMVMIVMVKKGRCCLEDRLANRVEVVGENKIAIFCSTRQDIVLNIEEGELFVLCIADFFLKRYLSGKAYEPIDFLYRKLQKEISLERIATHPIDAMSLYLEKKIEMSAKCENMRSIRAHQRVTEFMILRFSLLDIVSKKISEEERALATKAKAILLEYFPASPSIQEIAHRCATNSTKLKKVFKKVYQITLYAYVQKLRLEEANLLLKEGHLTIQEVAKRVGYKHQGHFSKLFFENYGVYPKELLKKRSS